MTTKPEKILYTAHATSTGGREGTSKTDDGILDVKLTTPKGLGGNGAPGTNPEQLFAAGYSACFIGAMKARRRQAEDRAARRHLDQRRRRHRPDPATASASRSRCTSTSPAWTRRRRRQLVEAAHQVCPYSNATRGNIEVALDVV